MGKSRDPASNLLNRLHPAAAPVGAAPPAVDENPKLNEAHKKERKIQSSSVILIIVTITRWLKLSRLQPQDGSGKFYTMHPPITWRTLWPCDALSLHARHTSWHQGYKVLPMACATRKLPLRQAACSKVVPFRSRACGMRQKACGKHETRSPAAPPWRWHPTASASGGRPDWKCQQRSTPSQEAAGQASWVKQPCSRASFSRHMASWSRGGSPSRVSWKTAPAGSHLGFANIVAMSSDS